MDTEHAARELDEQGEHDEAEALRVRSYTPITGAVIGIAIVAGVALLALLAHVIGSAR